VEKIVRGFDPLTIYHVGVLTLGFPKPTLDLARANVVVVGA
jgi:hypothetical protein